MSWQWSGNRPGGTVAEVKEQAAVAIESHRGNEIKKHGEPGNPAVRIERPGNDVVKKASELNVEKSADGPTGASNGEKKPTHDVGEQKKENGEAETGDKRKAEETTEANGDAAKKPKTDGEGIENGDAAPKKKGRPAKKGANGEAVAKKENKKREPKRAATESGEPRRSGRVASKSS